MKYLVDMISYENAFCGGYHEKSRREDYSCDWEVMNLSSEEVKRCLDNCVKIKILSNG